MADREWYRRETWSAEDEADFERRLMRARATSRSQYLRIQALHLAETGEVALAGTALRLLDRLMAEYPDPMDLPQVQLQRAEVLVALGDWEGAVVAYRAAVAAERRPGTIRTEVSVEFPWAVVLRGASVLYDEVEAILDAQPEDERPFPSMKFRWSAAKALLAEHRRDEPAARGHAAAALMAMAADRSGFLHHQKLGLVREVDEALLRRLRRLAG